MGHAGRSGRGRHHRRGSRAPQCGCGHLPGAGRAEPPDRSVLQARRLVEDRRRGPVHQDPRQRAGSPPVLGRDAGGEPGGPGGDQPLAGRHAAICASAGAPAADMTVVFDAGQNSEDNFAHLAGTGLHYVGSVPASGCPDLTALPASARAVAGQERFGGLTAHDPRRQVYGAERRAILTYSPELHQSQARGFDGTTLAKAGKKLDDLAATLARGKTRRPREKVEAEITAIIRKPWVRRVVTWQLNGEQPRDLRLSWGTDQAARAPLAEELFRQ